MLTTIKVYACYTIKIYNKQTPKKFQTGGRGVCYIHGFFVNILINVYGHLME